MKTIERLRELLKAGTQEPWELLAGEHQVTIRVGTAYVGAPYQQPHGRGACPVQLADGCLMVEGRNALPALLAVVEAQAAEIAAWREGHDADNEDGGTALVYDLTIDRDYAIDFGKRLTAACDKTDAALRALEGGAG